MVFGLGAGGERRVAVTIRWPSGATERRFTLWPSGQDWDDLENFDFAWRLLAGLNGAELEFADGRRYRADSIDELVRRQVGWQVPVEALAWWVRGLAAPGNPQQRVLDEEGRLSLLQQDGWQIEFGRYGMFDGEAMPARMTARQRDRTVKLAIRKWDLSGSHE